MSLYKSCLEKQLTPVMMILWILFNSLSFLKRRLLSFFTMFHFGSLVGQSFYFMGFETYIFVLHPQPGPV